MLLVNKNQKEIIMKKAALMLTKKVSEMALSYTRLNVNSFCMVYLHQPQLPNNAQKLKK